MGRIALMSGMMLGFAAACGGASSSPLTGAGAPDSGTHPGSDTGTDSGSDSGTQPGSDSATDSGTDSGKPDTGSVDAGCPSFCAKHTPADGTCDDFDESSAVPSSLKITTSAGGSVTISMAEAFSCSNSLSASLPMVLGNSAGSADAFAAIGFAAATQVTLDLEVYLPAADMESFVTYFALKLGDNSALGLQHHADPDWYLSNGPSFSINEGLNTAPLVGAWNHMTLTVVYSATSGSASLTYEGVDHAPHTVSYSGATESASSPVGGEAIVGMVASGKTEAAFTAYYDNVVVSVTK
jgi:hypothetical protein